MKFRPLYDKMLRLFTLSALLVIVSGCVTTKKRGEVSKFKKFYHNVTSEYNGYFNANELMVESEKILRESNQDNYTKILDVIDYAGVSDPKIVYPQLDKAIQKVTTVAALHQPGDWVDDCYVLMGKAQYMKQDYASTVETLEYFQNAFNPSNPYGRNYQKKRLKAGSPEARKEREKEREEKQKTVADERKAKEKEREDARKEAEKLKKQQAKEREEAAKARKSSSRSSSTPQRSSGSTSRSTRTPNPRTTRATNKPAPTNPQNVNTEAKKDTVVTDTTKDQPIAEKKESVNNIQAQPVQKPAAPPKEYSDGTSYNEGLLYLAMAYTRMEKFSNAEYLLKRLDEIQGHTKEVKYGLAPAFADLKVRSGKYEEAIPYLEQAIKTTKKKELKGRYNFILGQILQNRGDYRNAAQYFAKASKSSGRNFKMGFMASLNQIKNNAISGGRSASSVAGQLEKMLNEDKNKEYKDQIYFAMAEVEMSRNNEEKAKEYFSKSVASNSANPSLKSEAYYQIAQMYMPVKEYYKAKLYIDSCLLNLPQLDTRYEELSLQSKKLENTARFMQLVAEADSSLALSKLSKEDLRKLALERRKAGVTNPQTAPEPEKTSSLDKTYTRSLMGNSTFFAYNPVNVERGKNDFKSKWGNIPLLDDWRRSSKAGNSAAGVNENDKNDEYQNRLLSNRISEEEIKQILSDIPMDEESINRTKEKLYDALFGLGKAVKLDLDDSDLSNKYLERLITEKPDHVQKLEILYLLYRNYYESNDLSNAERVKKLILNQFPESNYAKVITDPNYAKSLADKVVTLDKFYDVTYQYFENKDYPAVLSRISEATATFGPNNDYMPRFSLLKAISTGNTQGKEAYIDALQETIVRYPSAPETIKAKEILRFLKGDEAAFNEVKTEEVETEFTKNDNERHYVVVVLFDYSDEVLQKAKLAANDYNQQFYSLSNLKIGEQTLNKEENTQLLLVRTFDNFAKANDYYINVYKDLQKFIPQELTGYELYPISQINFRKMISQRTHKRYRAFFEKNY